MMYQAGYKCRICGRTSLKGALHDEAAEETLKRMKKDMAAFMTRRASIRDIAAGIYPSPAKICLCESGDIGIMDFIGYKRVDDMEIKEAEDADS